MTEDNKPTEAGIKDQNNSNNPDFLTPQAAYQLIDVVKTAPVFESLTPRWFIKMLEWKPIEAGVFRVNKVKETDSPLCISDMELGFDDIPEGFIDYDKEPREYTLKPISSIVKISTRVSDLYGQPYDQSEEQLRLSVEWLRERQESLLINSCDYGILNNTCDKQRIKTRNGPPTPDDMDELISKVWKEPSFFLAHPRAIAAFGRECTRRGVPPVIIERCGGSFLSWRGIPIIPTDKLLVDGQKDPRSRDGKTNILLVRTGEEKQGIIGLYQDDLPGEHSEGLTVRFMGIDNRGVGMYLLILYSSACILAKDAVAVLEDVEVGNYYDYR